MRPKEETSFSISKQETTKISECNGVDWCCVETKQYKGNKEYTTIKLTHIKKDDAYYLNEKEGEEGYLIILTKRLDLHE